MAAQELSLAAPLPNLSLLARDRSRGGRLRLVEALVDLYLQPQQDLTDDEVTDFGVFIQEVFSGSVPADIRALLATRAAGAPLLPPTIARKLAVDEIEIAAPILRQSPHLDDQDLLDVIGLRKTGHQLAIAARAALSEAVGDALVLTGNPEVVGVVLKNAGAQLSRQAVDKCIDLARQIQALRLPLIQRPEFTAEDAARLMWWLPRELRQIIATRFGAAVTTVAPATPAVAPVITPAPAATVAEMLARFLANPPTEREADIAAAWLADRGAIQPALLVQVLRQRQATFYTALLARALQLPSALVRKCTGKSSGQLLAVLCKALNMDAAHFSSTVMLLCANKGGDITPSQLEDALSAYNRLTVTRAKTMIAAWRNNPDLLRARV